METRIETGAEAGDIDTPRAWGRLGLVLVLSTLGGVGMWSYIVALPAVQAEFGLSRSEATLPYTAGMVGFALGGVLMGRLSDRFGIVWPALAATFALAIGYAASATAQNIWVLALYQGALVGALGSAVMFAPMMAYVSHWFRRRRGIAVAIAASGNYVAGTVWPPIVQWGIEEYGWRQAHLAIGLVCLVGMLPLCLALRGPAPRQAAGEVPAGPASPATLGLSPRSLQALLLVAGLSCCVAMSMPQVHIVAYCGDLGYGVARGAEMLSLMLGFGIVSRVASGFIADRIGGLGTLLLGSFLQGVALLLYLGFDGLTSLYIISALFGLFQGGIVPSYAIIAREYFPASEAGARIGILVMATVFGMALGGWLSGYVFDLTGSYKAAFANGIFWNLLNLAIAVFLIWRAQGPSRTARLRPA